MTTPKHYGSGWFGTTMISNGNITCQCYASMAQTVMSIREAKARQGVDVSRGHVKRDMDELVMRTEAVKVRAGEAWERSNWRTALADESRARTTSVVSMTEKKTLAEIQKLVREGRMTTMEAKAIVHDVMGDLGRPPMLMGVGLEQGIPFPHRQPEQLRPPSPKQEGESDDAYLLRGLTGGNWIELSHKTAIEEVEYEYGACDKAVIVFLEMCECVETINEELGGKWDGLVSEERKKEILEAQTYGC